MGISTVSEELELLRGALTAPSVIYRPALFPDGNKWCALYGENLQEGIAGFGDTPAAAMRNFDYEWNNRRAGFTPPEAV